MKDVVRYLKDHREAAVADLIEFLRIPSVSTDPKHRGDIRKCASFVKDLFRRIGLSARVRKTAGHPAVEAWSHPKKGLPTVLFYGHYDVQPPEPLDEWISPPFEPEIRKGDLYARGACDDKGQVMAHIKAVEAWLAAGGELPVNVRFLVEGEEEIGGESLKEVVDADRDRFRADAIVVSDTPMLGAGKPAICCGIRGIVYLEVNLRTARGDLHSGLHGGLAPNAAMVLTEILGKLKRKDGRVNIPGFYDGVTPLTRKERVLLESADWNRERYLKEVGAKEIPGGEEKFHPRERQWARPTLDINGLISGFTGKGAKTVIPCAARAKISARLVPDQDPEQVMQAIEGFLAAHCPSYADLEVKRFEDAPPLVVSPESPQVRAAVKAMEKGFGKHPVLTREGGSIPILSYLTQAVGAPIVMMGFGRPDDNQHAPNEKFNIADFHRGAVAVAWYLKEIGGV